MHFWPPRLSVIAHVPEAIGGSTAIALGELDVRMEAAAAARSDVLGSRIKRSRRCSASNSRKSEMKRARRKIGEISYEKKLFIDRGTHSTPVHANAVISLEVVDCYASNAFFDGRQGPAHVPRRQVASGKVHSDVG